MGNVAVIDVETTGLNPYRHDRVIEVAAVVVADAGAVTGEFVSLVNPERDLGPSSIHGITARDVLSAPTFGEIAGDLICACDGCVALAGHNVRFDRAFLAAEFDRAGVPFPEVPTFCTMRLAGGGSLPGCCARHGIDFEEGQHSALFDARATAQLLIHVLNTDSYTRAQVSQLNAIRWPAVPTSGVGPVAREEVRGVPLEQPTYLQALLRRLRGAGGPRCSNEASESYYALLDQVLEDRAVDLDEAEALLEVADRWGIGSEDVLRIHRRYVADLVGAALEDQVLTEAERRDLELVADLLGVSPRALDEFLAAESAKRDSRGRSASAAKRTSEDLSGKRVCFTGETQCTLNGERMTREQATELATSRGMVVQNSVTKKLDILVVADPFTHSGKAKKARAYGVRMIEERVFWRRLGVEVG